MPSTSGDAPLDSARSQAAETARSTHTTAGDAEQMYTPRTLYRMQHTQPSPRQPQPTPQELERAAVQAARAEMLESRRAFWTQRWDQLQQGLATAIAAQEPNEFARAKAEAAAHYSAEKAASDAAHAALQQARDEQSRARTLIRRAQRVERHALDVEAQKQHVVAHYHHDLLAPYREAVHLQWLHADACEAERREMQLRESARATQRAEALASKHAAADAQRASTIAALERDQQRAKQVQERAAASRSAAQARSLLLRTGRTR